MRLRRLLCLSNEVDEASQKDMTSELAPAGDHGHLTGGGAHAAGAASQGDERSRQRRDQVGFGEDREREQATVASV
jgi:hypothetical protein